MQQKKFTEASRTRTPLPDRKNVCAIIVTHHPDLGLKDRIAALAEQVSRIVVVDNGSDHDALARLTELAAGGAIVLVPNGANLGVAAALNRGVARASMLGFAWVITFDHDSRVLPGLLDNLIRVCAELGPALPSLGLLGTNHIDVNSGETYAPHTAGDAGAFVERTTVITSGTLLAVGVFERVGPFREDLFIDSVDHEYSLRVRTRGYRVLLAVSPLLEHAMGSRRQVRFLPGVSVQTVNYSPFRWYYIVRNRLAVAAEYARREPAWALARTARLALTLTTTLAFEEDRLEKARCMTLGAFDLVTRHAPRRPPELKRKTRGTD